jgi:hypothetical protein
MHPTAMTLLMGKHKLAHEPRGREQGTEQGIGNREQRAGNREQGTGIRNQIREQKIRNRRIHT